MLLNEGNGVSITYHFGRSFLTIEQTELSHSGYYQCVAVNNVGAAADGTYAHVTEGTNFGTTSIYTLQVSILYFILWLNLCSYR